MCFEERAIARNKNPVFLFLLPANTVYFPLSLQVNGARLSLVVKVGNVFFSDFFALAIIGFPGVNGFTCPVIA